MIVSIMYFQSCLYAASIEVYDCVFVLRAGNNNTEGSNGNNNGNNNAGSGHGNQNGNLNNGTENGDGNGNK